MIKFERFTLENGLQVVVHEDPTSLVAAINVMYYVGARDENPNQTGFAHLFEHLMFSGSKNIPSYDAALQQVGGTNNAYTSSDVTSYHCTLPLANLETAFWLESDRMLSLAFNQKGLKVQKKVVVEEFKEVYLNQPYGDAWGNLLQLAYTQHPYQWPVIGKEINHISEATMEEVKAFFSKFYLPNNAVLAVAGGVTVAQVKQLSEKWFGPIPAGTLSPKIFNQEPVQQVAREQTVTQRVPLDALYKAYLTPGRLEAGFYATELLCTVLGIGKSCVLYRELVEGKEYFNTISASTSETIDPGLLVIMGRANENIALEVANAALDRIVAQIQEQGVTEAELEKAKNHLEASFVYDTVDITNRAEELAYATLLGDTNLVNRKMAHMLAVTREEVQQAAMNLLRPEKCSTLYYRPHQHMNKKLPTRAENFSEWYNELVKRVGLAEHAAVRGCMVIKPYGFAIWEKMQAILDQAFKATGHENAYFPLFIPKSYLSSEAAHVEGFAKECAVVTHYRLKMSEDGKEVVVDPAAKLEEELIVRPTSETIIWKSYKNWIQSYRDLPLLLNQWSNVVRWEMRTRLFLRTAEFLWQEGHTAHATKEEAEQEALQMLQVYADFGKNTLAIPFLTGIKTAHERFAGAEQTYTIEALMQDGKALQAGTSHFLGQRFAKAFDVTFTNQAGQLDYVWGTSWGVTTRLIGALIMTHSDDKGLVLPPRIAPIQVIIIPIYKNQDEKALIQQQSKHIQQQLLARDISAKWDGNDAYKPGWKFAEYELKGVPIRVVMGPNDLANQTAELTRRDTGEKITVSIENIVEVIQHMLEDIQENLYQRALTFRNQHTYEVNTYEEFKAAMEDKKGFVLAHWDGTSETEQQIHAETKATIRCIPLEGTSEPGTCIYTGKPSKQRVIFGQAY
eukprot:gene117-157_t